MTATFQKFVILASRRTGSNMLVSTLRSHENVACHGELFRANKKEFVGGLKVLAEIDEKFHDEKLQHAQWRDYLTAVFSASGDVSFAGFKLMLNHDDDVLKSLINDQEYKKIFLTRSNFLAMYSSEKVAKATGKGWAGPKAPTAKVEFVGKEFETFCAKLKEEIALVRTLLDQSGQEFLPITYEEVCKPAGIEQTFRFLGADPQKGWKVSTKKRNPSQILNRFSNRVEERKYLRKHDLLDLKVEDEAAANSE